MIIVSRMAARSAPRGLSAKVQLRLPQCDASQCAFSTIVGRADPAIVEEAGKVVPALEHVVDLLQDLGESARGFRAHAATKRACPREAACFFSGARRAARRRRGR